MPRVHKVSRRRAKVSVGYAAYGTYRTASNTRTGALRNVKHPPGMLLSKPKIKTFKYKVD